jgi:hypothetical protein
MYDIEPDLIFKDKQPVQIELIRYLQSSTARNNQLMKGDCIPIRL